MPSKAAKTSIAMLTTSEHTGRKVADLITEGFAADTVAVSLVDEGRGHWRVDIHSCTKPNAKALRALVGAAAGAKAAKTLRFATVAAKDWVAESLAGLKPVTAGRFIVHGAHDRAGIAPNRIGIEIEAALAFGTGHHGTTRGCLLALDRLCKSWRSGKAAPRILDLGTGSGVLAIAAARALAPARAGDRHRCGCRARGTRQCEAQRRRAAGHACHGERRHGPGDPRRRRRSIWSSPISCSGRLQRLAAPLAKIVAPGGRVVLSGLLTSQANAALAAYRAFRLERRIDARRLDDAGAQARQISRPRRCPMSAVPLNCSACFRRISSRSRIVAPAATAHRDLRPCGRN